MKNNKKKFLLLPFFFLNIFTMQKEEDEIQYRIEKYSDFQKEYDKDRNKILDLLNQDGIKDWIGGETFENDIRSYEYSKIFFVSVGKSNNPLGAYVLSINDCHAYLDILCVDQEHQRNGIGKALFKNALLKAKERNTSSFGLTCIDDNPILCWYKKIFSQEEIELPGGSFKFVDSIDHLMSNF